MYDFLFFILFVYQTLPPMFMTSIVIKQGKVNRDLAFANICLKDRVEELEKQVAK